MMRWLKTIFRKHIIRDVPNELATCKCDCRALELFTRQVAAVREKNSVFKTTKKGLTTPLVIRSKPALGMPSCRLSRQHQRCFRRGNSRAHLSS
jgi:hypothetical protein